MTKMLQTTLPKLGAQLCQPRCFIFWRGQGHRSQSKPPPREVGKKSERPFHPVYSSSSESYKGDSHAWTLHAHLGFVEWARPQQYRVCFKDEEVHLFTRKSPMPIPEQLRLLPPCHRSSWALGAWGLLLQIAKDHGDSSLIPKQCPEHMASLAGHCSCKLSKSQHSQAGAPITCMWQRPPLAAVAGSIIKRAWAISSCRRCVQSSNQQRTSRSHVCVLRQPTKNMEATSNTSERRLHCSTA